MNNNVPNTRTPWRETARRVAHEATLREARDRGGVDDHPVNYRWSHIQAVVTLALRLAALTGADPEVVEAAAWLHDCEKAGADDDHGVAGAETARDVLAQTDFPADKIEDVVEAIAAHVGLSRDEPLTRREAAVLWDADKLSKLGVAAVVHSTAAYILAKRGDLASLVTSSLEQAWYADTVDSFHTEAAREVGRRRLQDQRAFWAQVAGELEGQDLPLPADGGGR